MEATLRRKISASLGLILGDSWKEADTLRKAAALEFIDELMMQSLAMFTGAKTTISVETIMDLAKSKAAAAKAEEIRSLVTGDFSSYIDIGVGASISNTVELDRARRKLFMEILKLKEISFKDAELEKRRFQILQGVEQGIPFPADELDLFIISRVVPEVMTDEKKAEMIEWLGERLSS